MKLGNPDLHVIVTGGDGDGYGIGLGHFVHAMRRNLDITYIVMNNMTYGLTTGQTSPTTKKGTTTKSTPLGNLEEAINPLALALVSGASFVARGFSGQIDHLSNLFAQGIQHKGFALIDVFSPCITYMNTYPYFKEHCYQLEETDYQPTDFHKAMEKALEMDAMEDKVPIGVFYRVSRPTYEAEEPAMKHGAPVKQKLGISPEEGQKLLRAFM
jgi:2-oxoglutarate ferredoxin oxidoreductase subunit beta